MFEKSLISPFATNMRMVSQFNNRDTPLTSTLEYDMRFSSLLKNKDKDYTLKVDNKPKIT